MSEVNHYKCDKCGKVESDILRWWINRGDLHFNDGELAFTVNGMVQHWCSKKCLLAWIDDKCDYIDGKMYRGR